MQTCMIFLTAIVKMCSISCWICRRKDPKYSGILYSKTICNVCGESATYIEESYDKDNYSVRKCLRGECKKIDDEAPIEI